MTPGLAGRQSLAALRKGVLRFEEYSPGVVDEFTDDELVDIVRKEVWKWPPRLIQAFHKTFYNRERLGAYWEWTQGLNYLLEMALDNPCLADAVEGGDPLSLPFTPTPRQVECARNILGTIRRAWREEEEEESSLAKEDDS